MRKKNSHIWIINIFFISFFLAIIMSIIAELSIKNLNLFWSLLVLLLIIISGIVFDIIGIAVAVSNPKPFNAMASKKIKGAKTAVKLVLMSDRVSNFCNDVVGDIAGIISGAAIASIAFEMYKYDISILNISLISISLSGIVASLTVGGKACGKKIAIKHWKRIVFFVAYAIHGLVEKE